MGTGLQGIQDRTFRISAETREGEVWSEASLAFRVVKHISDQTKSMIQPKFDRRLWMYLIRVHKFIKNGYKLCKKDFDDYCALVSKLISREYYRPYSNYDELFANCMDLDQIQDLAKTIFPAFNSWVENKMLNPGMSQQQYPQQLQYNTKYYYGYQNPQMPQQQYQNPGMSQQQYPYETKLSETAATGKKTQTISAIAKPSEASAKKERYNKCYYKTLWSTSNRKQASATESKHCTADTGKRRKEKKQKEK